MFLKETEGTQAYLILPAFQNTGGTDQRNTKAINKINKLPNCGKFEVKEDPKFMVNKLNHSYSFNNGVETILQ